jgi:uncharacterized membrane protein
LLGLISGGGGEAVGLVTPVWMIYRIVKGWLRLSEKREVS